MTEEGEVEEEEHPEAEAEAVVEASLRLTTQDSWTPVPLHNGLRVVYASPEPSLISKLQVDLEIEEVEGELVVVALRGVEVVEHQEVAAEPEVVQKP